MHKTEVHPIEVAIVAGLVVAESLLVLVMAGVALLLTLAQWRPEQLLPHPLPRPCSLCVLSLSLRHPSILSAIHHGLMIPWASMDLENDRLSVVKDAP